MKNAKKNNKAKTPNYKQVIRDLLELQSKLELLGVHASALNNVKRELATKIESLPIITDGLVYDPEQPARGIYYFILSGSCWYPVHHGEELKNGIFQQGLAYQIDYQDGAKECGFVQKGDWSHCTADGQPNYHWLELVDEPTDTITTNIPASPEQLHPCPMDTNS